MYRLHTGRGPYFTQHVVLFGIPALLLQFTTHLVLSTESVEKTWWIRTVFFFFFFFLLAWFPVQSNHSSAGAVPRERERLFFQDFTQASILLYDVRYRCPWSITGKCGTELSHLFAWPLNPAVGKIRQTVAGHAKGLSAPKHHPHQEVHLISPQTQMNRKQVLKSH